MIEITLVGQIGDNIEEVMVQFEGEFQGEYEGWLLDVYTYAPSVLAITWNDGLNPLFRHSPNPVVTLKRLLEMNFQLGQDEMEYAHLLEHYRGLS